MAFYLSYLEYTHTARTHTVKATAFIGSLVDHNVSVTRGKAYEKNACTCMDLTLDTNFIRLTKHIYT